MVKERNIALCIIFSIITCGIYGIYWFIALTDETNMASDMPTASGGMAVLLCIVTCGLYRFYWSYKIGQKIDVIKSKMGVNSSDTAVLYLVLSIFGLDIVAECLAQNELNKLV